MSDSAFMRKLLAASGSRAREFLAALHLRHCDRVGDAPHVLGRPYIENHGLLEIGARLRLLSIPVRSHMVVHRGATLRIGDDVSFGYGSGVACHSNIQIADQVRVGAFTLILDSDYHVPGDPEARAEPSPIRIGRRVRIGSRSTILRGSSIGDGAVVASGSVVSGEIGPGVHVAGIPARRVSAPSVPVELSASSSIESRVAVVAMHVFRLEVPPLASDGPAQIASWDSLGALSFLLALEDEFAIMLTQDETAAVNCLADLVPIIGKAQARRLGQAEVRAALREFQNRGATSSNKPPPRGDLSEAG